MKTAIVYQESLEKGVIIQHYHKALRELNVLSKNLPSIILETIDRKFLEIVLRSYNPFFNVKHVLICLSKLRYKLGSISLRLFRITSY